MAKRSIKAGDIYVSSNGQHPSYILLINHEWPDDKNQEELYTAIHIDPAWWVKNPAKNRKIHSINDLTTGLSKEDMEFYLKGIQYTHIDNIFTQIDWPGLRIF